MMGPTAPEPATEGKDLAGGFIYVRVTGPGYSHKHRLHVAPFGYTSPDYLYTTPPSGLFSDAGPNITATEYMTRLADFYPATWTMAFDSLWSMVAGEPVQQFPNPVVASVAGTSSQSGTITYTPAGQYTFTTRDDHGHPFKVVLLGPANWTPLPPQAIADNSAGNAYEKLVHFLAANGAVRSHAGNKPLAPMKLQTTLNRRLRREYHLT